MPTLVIKDLFLNKWGVSGASPAPELQSWTSLDYDISGSTDYVSNSTRNYVTFKEPVLYTSIYNQGGTNRGVSPGSIWNVPAMIYLAGGAGVEMAQDNMGNVWALSKSINGALSGRASSPIGEPLTPAFNGTAFGWTGFDTGYGITRSGYSTAQDVALRLIAHDNKLNIDYWA